MSDFWLSAMVCHQQHCYRFAVPYLVKGKAIGERPIFAIQIK
jgi:hypothetical protein